MSTLPPHPRAVTDAPLDGDGDRQDAPDRPDRGPRPEWPVPDETDRPHTAALCTTVAMLISCDLSLSGGYVCVEDVLPVGTAQAA